MTPAVTGLKGVANMIAVSRRHCFISKFAGVRNHMNEKVYASLGQDAPDGNFDGKSWMHLANIVADLGYFPEITYCDYAWENFIPLEQAVERFFDGCNMQLQDNAENRRRVRDAHMRGKQAFSFYNRANGKSVRLVLKPRPAEMTKDEAFRYYQECSPEDMFEVKEAAIVLPERARLFDSYPCECCGEETGANWIRIAGGRKLCLDCYQTYDRFNV